MTPTFREKINFFLRFFKQKIRNLKSRCHIKRRMPCSPIFLLVWQQLRPLGTFSHDAAQLVIRSPPPKIWEHCFLNGCHGLDGPSKNGSRIFQGGAWQNPQIRRFYLIREVAWNMQVQNHCHHSTSCHIRFIEYCCTWTEWLFWTIVFVLLFHRDPLGMEEVEFMFTWPTPG